MENFTFLGQNFSLLELAAVAFSLLGVWLAAHIKTLGLWLSMLGAIGYFFVFRGQHLFCSMWLQLIFVAENVYGIIFWQKEKNDNFSVKKLKIWQKIAFLVLMHGIGLTLGRICFEMDKSVVENPVKFFYLWDGMLSAASLIGQWLLVRKYLDNWKFWIIVNANYIILFLINKMPISAVLYAVFLVIAVNGLRRWKKMLN